MINQTNDNLPNYYKAKYDYIKYSNCSDTSWSAMVYARSHDIASGICQVVSISIPHVVSCDMAGSPTLVV